MWETVLYAFFTSDNVGRGIVLVLLGLSAISWSIVLTKSLSIWNVSRSCRRFTALFQKCDKSPLAMGHQFRMNKFEGPLKEIFSAGMKELVSILQISSQEQPRFFREGRLPRKLMPEEIDKIRASMNREMDRQSVKLDESLVMQGIIISVSPLLGLFGTVWGVMMTFIGIAKVGKPDIMAIAPGVSGALLTTVAGLFVAIPSMIHNHFMNGSIDRIYRLMDTFIDEFISSLRLEEISKAYTANPTAMNSQPDFVQEKREADAP